LVSANDKLALGLNLSAENEHDAPVAGKLPASMKDSGTQTRLLMDKAYEGDETQELAEELGYIPVVSFKSNGKNHGNMTKSCTNNETWWRDYSED
jgi:hypothetical protein